MKRLVTHSRVGTGKSVALESLLANSYVRTYIGPLDVCQRAASGIVQQRPGTHRCIAAGGVQ